MEKTYVQKVNDWLNADSAERNLEAGAELMLQGNRNRILRDNVLRKRNFEKIEYELTKIIGSDREVKIDIVKMDQKAGDILLDVEKQTYAGKRPDHDSLPEELKLIVDENTRIYHEMRSIFEKIKLLSEEGNSPEERVPFLKQLFALESTLVANWKKYDEFTPGASNSANTSNEGNKPIDAKRVTANRKYLSENKKKYPLLVSQGKAENAARLLDEMQKRYNELVMAGQTFDPIQLTELEAIGILIAKPGNTESEPVEGIQLNNDLPPAVGANSQSGDGSGNEGN